MCRYTEGAASEFHTYIQQLPKDFDLLSMWSDEVGGQGGREKGGGR